VIRLLIPTLLASLVAPVATMAAPTFLGPVNPYLSAADIPVGFYGSGSPTGLEDFEDGSLDFGITASAGFFRGPGTATDSVDGDDGSIDGSGLDGSQWLSGDAATGVTFTFPSAVTAAGIAWTDGALGATVTFEAFGPGMVSLGTQTGVTATSGFTGQTIEDSFYGVQDPDGIIAIKLSAASGGIEMDHVQFGIASFCGDGVVDPGEECDDGNTVAADGCEIDCTFVPEPAAPLLLVLGATVMVACGARRRR